MKEDREKILKKVTEKYGSLNVLINNAGVAPKERKDILDASEESFDYVMDINLKGPYFFTQMIARHMVERRKRDNSFECCIINVSSVSASVAYPHIDHISLPEQCRSMGIKQ